MTTESGQTNGISSGTTVRERVKWVLKQRGWTTAEWSQRAGYGYDRLLTPGASAEDLKRLVKAAGVSGDWLIAGTGTPKLAVEPPPPVSGVLELSPATKAESPANDAAASDDGTERKREALQKAHQKTRDRCTYSDGDAEAFLNRLAQASEKSGLSLKQASRAVNRSDSFVAGVRHAITRREGVDLARAAGLIAPAFKVSPEWLLGKALGSYQTEVLLFTSKRTRADAAAARAQIDVAPAQDDASLHENEPTPLGVQADAGATSAPRAAKRAAKRSSKRKSAAKTKTPAAAKKKPVAKRPKKSRANAKQLMEFATRLAHAAKARELTYTEISKKLGKSHDFVSNVLSRIKTGTRRPDIQSLSDAIAPVLKVSSAWLATGDGPMRAAPKARAEKPSPAPLSREPNKQRAALVANALVAPDFATRHGRLAYAIACTGQSMADLSIQIGAKRGYVGYLLNLFAKRKLGADYECENTYRLERLARACGTTRLWIEMAHGDAPVPVSGVSPAVTIATKVEPTPAPATARAPAPDTDFDLDAWKQSGQRYAAKLRAQAEQIEALLKNAT